MKKLLKLVFVSYMVLFSAFELCAQTPGTSGDPLVTKSYLDFAAKLRKVEIKSGTKIAAESGALIIVISGQLKVELKKGGFVIDLTSGRRIVNNLTLQPYHLIMVPEGGDCGFKASKDSTLMALGLNDEAE